MRALRALRREVADVASILATPATERPVVAYSEDSASYGMLAGYLEQLIREHGRNVLYITSDLTDPLLGDARGMQVRYARRLLPTLLSKIDSAVLLTSMPEFDKHHLKRTLGQTRRVFAFRSLDSIHEVYREGAFDGYDDFLCAGPHHRRELRAHFESYGLRQPNLHDVGYYRLDRMARDFEAYRKKDTTRPVVLLAPSWGTGNSLERAGKTIIESLLAIGVRVIVRPHPCFFLPVYPQGKEVVADLQRRFSTSPLVTIETSVQGEESYFEADMMISDFSGAALEYAIATLRPVVFVDVSRKTMNLNWKRLRLPTFEDTMRSTCGEIVSPEALYNVAPIAQRLLRDREQWRQHLMALRVTAVYNFGRSAEIGAQVLDDLARS